MYSRSIGPDSTEGGHTPVWMHIRLSIFQADGSLSKMIGICLLTMGLVTHSWSVLAEEIRQDFDWKLVSNEKGLFIYSAKPEKYGIVPIRFHTVLDFPPSRVLTVLGDTERRTEWTPNLVEASIFSRVDIDHKIEYLRYHFPWPFRDRTYLIQTLNYYNSSDRSIVFKTQSVMRREVPETSQYIRADTLLGITIIRPEESGRKTYLEAIFLTDMKGNIPKWLFNEIQKSWPFKMMSGLNQQLSRNDIRINQRWRPWDY